MLFILNSTIAMVMLRSLSIYRRHIESLPEFRVISPPLTEALFTRMGFTGNPNVGDTLLPGVVGRITSFNALGSEIIRKDLPKEPRSRMINTSWKDWHGKSHSGTQYRHYEAYPRELVPPPSEELTIYQHGSHLIAASRVLRNDEQEQALIPVLNLFLEIFDRLEIVHENLAPSVTVQRVNWRILPPGEYPYARVATALADYFERLPEDARAVAEFRVREITRHRPDFIAVGIGGFGDYVVFGFTDRSRYVLESPLIGNATYIFRNEWERFAALSKAEIIQGDLQEARLVHTNRWPGELRSAIQRQ
jgi:hypothetical protein